MQLICPKCEAPVDVEDDGEPDRRRPIRCSSCNESWFAGGRTDLYALSFTKPSNIDPEVVRILQDEAEREISARKQETGSRDQAPASPTTELEIEPNSTASIKVDVDKDADYVPLNKRQRWILLALCLLGSLVALYVFAPEVVRRVPSITDWVFSYVFWVNDMWEILGNGALKFEAFIISLDLGGLAVRFGGWTVNTVQTIKEFALTFRELASDP